MPVVEDINKMYEGYKMKHLQNKILVLMRFGDTLGQHFWGRGWSI